MGLNYDFDLGGHASYVSGDYAYVGEMYSRVGEAGLESGDYGQLNMSAGINFNQFDVEFYVHNLTDDDALTHADTLMRDGRVYRLRPRTIGLNVGYQF